MTGAVLLLCAVGRVAVAAEYVNPKFKSGGQPVKTVLLLPAQVELTKSGMKGAEGMAKESEQMTEKITVLITQQLQASGVTVLPNPFTEEAFKSDSDMQATLNRLQNKYDTMATQLHSKPKEVRKGRYSLGDEVSTLAPAAKADGIVFIRASGTVLTGGKKAFGWMVTGQVSDTIHTFMTLVDAKSGDVIAVVNCLRAGNFQEKTDKVMGKTLANSFKKLPFAGK
jgi:hypothetical protein